MIRPADLPLPAPGDAWALFLDFDGTLAEIAPTPDAVHVAPELPSLLRALHTRLGGALAVVSGRTITDIDQLLAPARLPVAGVHGLERRDGVGELYTVGELPAGLDGLRRRLHALAAEDPALLVEDKGRSVVLHYRRAPHRADALLRLVEAEMRTLDGYHLLAGKMMLEAKPAAADKGHAVDAYMREPPFAGRRAVFAGDDVTDEDAFAVVQRLGGLAIKVGDGDTRADARCGSVAALHRWLRAVLAQHPPACSKESDQ